MAQSTRDIKRRIKGIGNMMQITNAMGLVSSAKLVKAREKLIRTRPYYYTVLNNIERIFGIIEEIDYPLLQKRDIKRSLYIVISDDRGLAGGYNNNIVKLVEKEVLDKKEDVDLILIGSKAVNYFERRGYHIIKSFTGITEEPDYSDAEEIGELAFRLYRNHRIDEIKIAFTKFINNISHEPELRQLLPPVKEDESKKRQNPIVDFEPSPKEVLDYLVPKYVVSNVYGALIEASCSEQAARRLAMEVATENAREIIEDLQTKYNRARQAAITTEITEIITGSEILK